MTATEVTPSDGAEISYDQQSARLPGGCVTCSWRADGCLEVRGARPPPDTRNATRPRTTLGIAGSDGQRSQLKSSALVSWRGRLKGWTAR